MQKRSPKPTTVKCPGCGRTVPNKAPEFRRGLCIVCRWC